ncbi:MAG TPA: alpha-hydroxy acid oxidase, partial [Candidatus Sulfotelmatobacter sp.]|nr:alpha-hydroxy acid oxidase [Candidatus Sulfotelmatobacter sp.]
MDIMPQRARTRRKFLKMLGASPLITGSSMLAGTLADLLRAEPLKEEHFWGWLESLHEQSDSVISSPDQAFDVTDFEPAARKAIPPAHWGYLTTGVDDDATVRANRDGYAHVQIRSRRLVDVAKIDMSRTIFGVKWDSPIVLSPVGAQKAFHPDGELGVARAAKTKGHLMMLSTVATVSIEDAIAARGGPVWQQLYPTNVWEVTRAIIKRAETAGSPAIVLTVDLHEGSNRETLFRSERVDKRPCSVCHAGG